MERELGQDRACCLVEFTPTGVMRCYDLPPVWSSYCHRLLLTCFIVLAVLKSRDKQYIGTTTVISRYFFILLVSVDILNIFLLE